MSDPRTPKPPALGRLILRLRRLGGRRREVEEDLRDLFERRVLRKGRAYAGVRYMFDALSFWRWRIGAFVAPDGATRTHRHAFVPFRGLTQDVAFAVRMFRGQPGIVSLTVAGLSLAIGLSTVILTIANALTLRSTGIASPELLYSVNVSNLYCGCTVGGYSPMRGNWASMDFTRLGGAISAMELAADSPFTTPVELRRSSDRGSSESIPLMPVSGNYFQVVGARPAAGRVLRSADDAPVAARVAVMSHTLWKVRFEADPAIVGQTVWLDDVPFTVVGVAERGFVGAHGSKYQTSPAVWITFSSQEGLWLEQQRAAHDGAADEIARLSRQPSLDAIGRMRLDALRSTLASAPARWNVPVDVAGRLRPGASVVRAEAELTAMARIFATDGRSAREQPAIVKLGPSDHPQTDPTLSAIVAAIVVVLLALGCSNVANLLLANAAGRQREIGTRLALGAGRARLVRQLLTESVVLGTGAGVAGLILARWLTPLIAALLPLPDLVDLAPDLGVYATAALVTLAAGMIAGVAPARYGLRGDLLAALQTDRAGTLSSPRQNRLRSVLVSGQAAACVVLLVLAALLTRSAVEASKLDTGVAIHRLVNVSPNLGRGYDAARTDLYLSVALNRLEQLPAVAGAALATVPPFHTFHARMSLVGSPVNVGPASVQRNEVSPDYFETVGVRFLQGRTFAAEEVRNQTPVAIISSSLARQFWGDASPLGSTLDRVWGPPDPPGKTAGDLHRKPAGTRVVGVVTDSMTQIDDHRLPTIYLPIDTSNAVNHIVVATHGDPLTIVSDLRREVVALDPNVRPYILLPQEKLRDGLQASHALAGITSAIGASALVLAVIGLFGVTAFVVGQRRREISIRMALGATGRSVVRMLVRDSLRPVAIGLGCGLVLAFISGQLIKSMLLGISGHDPIAILAAVTVLIGTAGLAAFVPARRAARIDPALTLKQD